MLDRAIVPSTEKPSVQRLQHMRKSGCVLQNVLCSLLTICVLTGKASYAANGKVGSVAQLDSDSIILKYDTPIKNVQVVFQIDGDRKDIDIKLFIQALRAQLYKKGFNVSNASEKADLVLSLVIKKIFKEYWVGLPMMFGTQRRIGCISVDTTYKTHRGEWNKEFIAHKGYWTFKGDSYFRDTTTNDLARAIVNPLHNYTKEKALITAAGNGDIKTVISFIKENININAENDLGYTPLIAASKNGHGEIIQLLISLKADLNAKDQDGWSSLTNTVFNGDEENTLLLLNNGAYIDTIDHDEISPLDWAVLEGRKNIVMILLSHDASIGNALGLAQQKGFKELEEILSEYNKKEKSTTGYNCRYLTGLLKSESTEKIQNLIKNNLIIVDLEDNACKNALITAVSQGNKQIIDSFLSKGFDVNAENANGDAPLMEAAAKGHKEIIKMLLSKGANLNNLGSSALASAAMNGQTDAAEYLLSQMVDINAPGKSGITAGETPLGIAASAGQKEMLELLLSKGAEINSKNEKGKTALMRAALEGKTEIVEVLLSNGADINQEDKDGNTVFDLVSKARMQENIDNIDYRDVIDALKREEHKISNGQRMLKSVEKAPF